jgi:hypothetical protein
VQAKVQVAQNAVSKAGSQSRWRIGISVEGAEHQCRKAGAGRPIEMRVADPQDFWGQELNAAVERDRVGPI